MAGLTRALVARHALGRAEAYDAALLDVAQDHLLYLLSQTVQFGDNRLVFKGGTSLRKCRLGNVGRFSTDLDFSAPDDEVVLEVCELIDGARVGGFEFGVQSTRGDGRHWQLRVRHTELGEPRIVASVEFARRPLLCRLSCSHSSSCRSIRLTVLGCRHCRSWQKRKPAQRNSRGTAALRWHGTCTT